MNIVKHLNALNSHLLPKKPLQSLTKHFPALILAVIIGTFLDQFFVKLGIFQFPHRPFPEIFSVNIFFTFFGIPLIILVYLSIMQKVSLAGKGGLILFLSLLMTIMEKLMEVCGLFIHAASWKHIYSLWGFLVFFFILHIFDCWVENKRH